MLVSILANVKKTENKKSTNDSPSSDLRNVLLDDPKGYNIGSISFIIFCLIYVMFVIICIMQTVLMIPLFTYLDRIIPKLLIF